MLDPEADAAATTGGAVPDLATAPPDEGIFDASNARVCKEEKQPKLHNQPLSFLTNYAIAISKEKKFFPANQESLIVMSYLYDMFLQPLVNVERNLSELKTDYVHKSVRNHHLAGRAMCTACSKTAHEAEMDFQLTVQDLKMTVVRLYENVNFLIFPQRFDEGQQHTCWHNLQGPSHLSRDCQVSQ